MKKFKSIVGILLGIYSIVVLHNITPHFHCNSDSKIVGVESMHLVHNGIHHSHQHDHNHDQKNESENENWFDSFLSLLGDLEHHELGEGHFENFTAQSQTFNFTSSISSEIVDYGITFNGTILLSITEKVDIDYIDRPPIIPEQYHFCSSSLRGPPSS